MKNISKYIFYLAVLSIPFYVWRFKVGVPTTITEVLVVLAFITALISAKDRSVFKNKFFIAELIFTFIAFVSALVSPDKLSALGIWRAYFLDGLLLVAAYNLIEDESKLKNTLSALVLGGVISTIIALVVFSGGVKTADGRLLDLDRLSPNYLGMYLVPLLVLAVSGVIQSIKKKATVPAIIWLLASLVFIAAIILAGSRGAELAAFVGVFGVILLLFKKYFKTLFILLIVLVLLSGAYIFQPVANDMGRTGMSSNIRVEIWKTSLQIIGRNPVLGVGLDNFQNYFTNFTSDRVNYPEFISPVALTAHDLYLHLLVVGGPLLLLAFLYLLYASKFYKNFDAISVAVVAILVFGLIDTPFFRNDLALVFWLILALGSSRAKKQFRI